MEGDMPRIVIVFTIARFEPGNDCWLYIGIPKQYFRDNGKKKVLKRLPKLEAASVRALGEKFKVFPVYIKNGLDPLKCAHPIDRKSVYLALELEPDQVIQDTMSAPWSLIVCEHNFMNAKLDFLKKRPVDRVFERELGKLFFIPVQKFLEECDSISKDAIFSLLYYLVAHNRIKVLYPVEWKTIRFDQKATKSLKNKK